MNDQVLSKYDVMSVAEGAGRNLKEAHELVDAERNELSMAYAFDAIDIAKPNGYSLLKFKRIFSEWDSAFAQKGWISIFLANHDQARSRFGNDSPQFREISSKMLSTFLMTMRGTPYSYFGDEIGMTNADFKSIDEYRDMPTLNEYQYQLKKGADMEKFMASIKFSCRDNGRTNFQWDSTPNSGFSTGIPWIKTAPDYTTINAAAQENDPNSCLNYFRKLTKLRKKNLVLVYGQYTLLDKQNPDIYAYTREYEGKKMLIVLNFSKEYAETNLGLSFKKAKSVLNNYNDKVCIKDSQNTVSLKPYQAIVFELK
jgi:oligo-1,6-glucosidase